MYKGGVKNIFTEIKKLSHFLNLTISLQVKFIRIILFNDLMKEEGP